jgi:hypothetical protein
MQKTYQYEDIEQMLEGPSKSRPYSEGMHEAIDDIAKAMKALASYLS